MTDQQKTQTIRLRGEGFGYSKIAVMLGLSDNTIKSFCRRNGLTGMVGYQRKGSKQEHFCPTCGLPVKQNPGRKEKKFCSDRCRNRWWNTHLDQVNRKALYEYECVYCGKPFVAYGNANRKYCSHECYVNDRFGGGGDD